MRIDLKDGEWIEVRDPRELGRKAKRAVLLASEHAASPAGKAFAMADAILAMLVTGWSYDRPVPQIVSGPYEATRIADLDSFGDLGVLDDHELEGIIGEARSVLFPDFDPSPDPGSPTVPSSESPGGLRAETTGSPSPTST